MQTFHLDLQSKGIVPLLYAKQRDVGTKICVVLTNNRIRYPVPENTQFSVWFSGKSGDGNYTEIDGRSAFFIDDNEVTVELIYQMLNNPGEHVMCLVMNDAEGNQKGLWNIPYFVEAIPGADSEAATDYYNAFLESQKKAEEAAERAEAAADRAESAVSGASANAVSYIPQTLTKEQQAQARENIGAADGKFVQEQISGVKSDFSLAFEQGKNLIDPRKLTDGVLLGNKGNINVTETNYRTTDFIPISAGDSITISGNVRRFLAYDTNKNSIQDSYVVDQTDMLTYTATQDGYVRVSFHIDNLTRIQAEYGIEVTDYEPFCFYMTPSAKFGETQKEDALNTISFTVNLIDPLAFTEGYIDRNTGVISASSSYVTTDFIPIRAGESIVFSPVIRKFLAFRTDKASIASTFVNSEQENYTFTATQDGYVRASFNTKYIDKAQAEYGTIATPYIQYGRRRLKPEIETTTDTDSASGNILYGKKWCACGDSFTQGDFTGLQESEYLLQDGKYAWKNAVYPYIIGNRNNMDIVNIARGGMTMCFDGSETNSFTYNDYFKSNIPLDSDYITLKFGINDNNHDSPLGNIDDAVNTTFYGAWNLVLDWLTQNFPTAKIGIIITNGITDEVGKAYLDATIAVAQKWGIAYLDEVNDYKIPLLLRVKRPNLSDVVYNRKLETFSVSEKNKHPNVACHEYESTFVEHFLRSL